jgi:hypothetical protein
MLYLHLAQREKSQTREVGCHVSVFALSESLGPKYYMW